MIIFDEERPSDAPFAERISIGTHSLTREREKQMTNICSLLLLHLIEGGRHIADAKFQRRKERMRVDIGKIVEISSTID